MRDDSGSGAPRPFDHDFVVIGSGFGGSVAALRLVEKGYDVRLLEKGRDWRATDFPRTNWNLRRWIWAPALGLRGFFKMTFFRHVTVLSGVGVGGGSLVYAATLPVPKQGFFESPAWAHLGRWESELEPHYRTAERMLGATTTRFVTRSDRLLEQVAAERGTPDAWQPARVGIHFGEPGERAPDPYFGGEGPERIGCTGCGACMTGCRHGAKNTLDMNYLHLARRRGLRLDAETEVTAVRPLPGGGYRVEARRGAGPLFRTRVTFTAQNVVFAGGVMGSVDLLLRMKRDPRGLPSLSDRLGERVRTNSEALIGVTTSRPTDDFSQGVAIGSMLQINESAHGEVVRYGAGSGAFRLLLSPHVHGSAPGPVRILQAALTYLRRPLRMLRTHLARDWARQTIIVLFMRTAEGALRLRLRRGLLSWFRPTLASDLLDGHAPTARIPEASDLADEIAAKVDGQTCSLLQETILGIPTTAHILGGCPMGATPAEGVIDAEHRVHGYAGLWVIDGSAVSANPGVNPSLTITALAERAMSLVPRKDQLEGSVDR